MDEGMVHRVLNAFHRLKKSMHGFMPDRTLHGGEFFTLEHIYMAQQGAEGIGASVSQIHRGRRMSMPAVSQMLGSLEKKGLVTRNISAGDRRKIDVSLTPKGVSVYLDAKKLMDDRMHELLERFGKENLEEFISLIDLLVRIMDDLNENKGDTNL